MNLQTYALTQIISIKVSPRQAFRALGNPHLWLIFLIMIAMSYMYYIPFPEIEPEALWRFRATEFQNHIIGSLFYLPIIYSAVIFGWIGILTVWTLSMAIIFPRVLYYTTVPTFLLSNIMFLTLPIILGLFIIFSLKWLDKERKTYIERERERQEYTAQVLKAQEDERKRISQELHDDTIQTLLAVADRMQHLLHKEGGKLSPQTAQQVELYNNTLYRVTEDLRRMSIDLRPSILDNIGLVEAVRWVVDDLDGKGIKANLVINGQKRTLRSEDDVHVFRFIQEALNNVRAHSGATDVVVQLDFRAESMKIVVQDDGKGFILPELIGRFPIKGKLGIVGMQERARLLGGNFNIRSQPGQGTSVSLEFKT